MAKYQVSKRKCSIGKMLGSCRGVVIRFPDVYITGNSEPLCREHAEHYFGEERIARLIRLGFLPWKPRKEEKVNPDQMQWREVTNGNS